MAEHTSRLSSALADRYRIERRLGEGGMATVYLAEDLKHKRQVALKVLKPDLAAVLGAERFVQEITTTASLQHPHILPLFDSGQADGFLYYVMPYIEGETLRDKLDRDTQLGIDEAVRIATEVADALHYAHQQGVIHRDIKPENILIQNGRPMVADFGIALAVSAAAGGRMTETGLSLGTPHYMSPEQATAEKELSARSDVYSLASVLYEMLAGEPPHLGGSAQAIIMKIVTETADPVTKIRKSVPPHVAAAVAQALEKLPADRFDSAAAFARALATPGFTNATGIEAAPRAAPGATRRAYAIGAGAGLVVGIAAMLAWSVAQPAPERPVIRYGLALPDEQSAILVGDWNTLALSPDGSKLVYVGGGVPIGQLWVKHRDSHEPVPIPGTTGARDPVVSPDGRWIAYRLNNEIRKIAVGGGSSVSLADSAEDQNGGTAWLDDGSIVYVGTDWHIRVVPEEGGVSARAWSSQQADRYATNPTPIPGGVLFSLCSSNCVQVQDLWMLDLESGTAREVMTDAARGWALPTGHLITIRRDGGVFAAPWHGPSRELRGPAIPLFEGVGVYLGIQPSMEISAAGQLAYIPGAGSLSQLEAVWVSMDGEITAVDPDWTVAMGGSPGWRISPDGSRLAVSLLTEAGEDIWIKELDRGPLTRLTFDEQLDTRPVWAPDGRSILFISDRAGDAANNVYSRLADGTGTAELVLDREEPLWEAQWSSDREWIVFRDGGTTQTPRNISALRVDADSVHPLVTGRFQERSFALSPDGRWLVYVSDETGRDEVYVRPFPEAERGKWSVSTSGGSGPLWSRAGDRLFYISAENQMVAVTFRAEESFSILRREPLFAIGVDVAIPLNNYTEFDIDANDGRFLFFRRQGGDVGGEQAQLIMVENWTQELPQPDGR